MERNMEKNCSFYCNTEKKNKYANFKLAIIINIGGIIGIVLPPTATNPIRRIISNMSNHQQHRHRHRQSTGFS